MSPKPDVSAIRIPQILEAAMFVFAEKGLHQARMSDVAERAGLSKGTVYLYFKDKNELVFSVLKASLSEGFEALEQILESEGSVAEQILDWVDKTSSQMEESVLLLRISYEFYALAGRKEDVREELQGYFSRYRALLKELLELGIQRKEFRPMDTELIALAIMAIFEGVNVLIATGSPDEDWSSNCVRIVRHLLDGIRQ